MSVIQSQVKGSATVQSALWGARVKDWADFQESTALPLYEAVLARTRLGKGVRLLDVGCGSGMFCALALKQGATVGGLDATSPSIDIAKGRAAGGDFRVGEMEELPFPDRSFDVVTGFNSFQYAANPVNALQEAHRVMHAHGQVVIATWGRPQDCEAAAYLAALRPLMPPPPPGAPGPFALSEDGALAVLVKQVGLTPMHMEDVECPFDYPDLETALRGLLSAGPAVRAIQTSGEQPAREAVANAIAPFKQANGAYRLKNKFRYMIATQQEATL